MLFFLLLNAAPAMNHPSPDDDNSPRKKWLDIVSQILNALFCVTGFFARAPYNVHFTDFTSIVGTFIGLECGVAALAGLMSWWEGRKVKKIEEPEVKAVV
jgi:hypothetical protein